MHCTPESRLLPLSAVTRPHRSTGTQVVGLSKFNRIVHHICERPQIQEEMTSQIADALRDIVKTPHMCAYCFVQPRCTLQPPPISPPINLTTDCPYRAVVVKAEHHCMTQVRTSVSAMMRLLTSFTAGRSGARERHDDSHHDGRIPRQRKLAQRIL